MAEPPRRTEQAPPAAAAQAAPARAETRPANRSSTPRPTAGPPTSGAARPAGAPLPAAAPPPENLRIEAVDVVSHPLIAFEWRAVRLGSNESKGLTVTAADGGELTLTLDQGSYQRTLQGRGSVSVAAIPAAPKGTTGRLLARHDATGAAARFTWQWTAMAAPAGPPGDAPAGPPPGDAPAPRGFWSRLFGGRPAPQAAPPLPIDDMLAPAPPVVEEAPATTPERVTAAAVPYTTGAAGTFFGMRAKGRRFAFILDFSGSMLGPRWATVGYEVANAFRGLPPTAECFVIAFCSRCIEPPGQAGWVPLGPGRGAEAVAWVERMVPWGLTRPAPAFDRVFSLGAPPDTIFFVTDGLLENFGSAQCLAVRGAHRTVVHAIAIDEDPNDGELQRIAEATGGQYIRVACPPVSPATRTDATTGGAPGLSI